jgi:hypothetical protein
VGCSNRFGRGRALLIGTLMGPAVLEAGGGSNQAFLATVLASAGVRSDRVGPLLRRRRTRSGRSAWFLINPKHERVEVSVPLEGNRAARDLLGAGVQIERGQAHVNVGPMDVVCLLVEN